MEKEFYSVKDLQIILNKSYSFCYRLLKKLQKELYRKNPNYKLDAGTVIPKWYFDQCILGKNEREN